jgi:hypothetical protein
MTTRALRIALGLGISAALLTGCSAPASDGATTADAEETSAPTSASTDNATDNPSDDASDAAVNQLPPLDGVSDGTPEGWLTGACGDLTFSYPATWTDSDQGRSGYSRVSSPPEMSSTAWVAADGTPTTLATTIGFTCRNEDSTWDGSWSAADAESYSVDVPGGKVNRASK